MLIRGLIAGALLALLFAPVLVEAGDLAEDGGARDWNDRGLRYYRSGDFRGALHCFDRALDFLPDDQTLLFNMASCHAKLALDNARGAGLAGSLEAARHAQAAVDLQTGHPYFHKVLGYVYQEAGRLDDAYAAFDAAASLDPADAATLALLGNVSYRLDDLDGALSFWEESIGIDPSQSKLEDRMARATKERLLEDDFRTLERRDFSISYDPSVDGARHEAERVGEMLEFARRDVSDVLGHRADRVPVVLYSPDRFRQYMGEHGWTRGLYDGKIRLPLPTGNESDEELRGLVTHEYVHAVVYELSEDQCPAWLNEGLAQVLAKERRSSASNAVRGSRNRGPIPLSALEESFLELPPERVESAYAQSYLVVSYLLERYTKHHVRRLLRSLASGTEAESAVERVFRVTYDELVERAMG